MKPGLSPIVPAVGNWNIVEINIPMSEAASSLQCFFFITFVSQLKNPLKTLRILYKLDHVYRQ